MKIFFVALLSLSAIAANAAPEAPRAVAERILQAWRDSDAAVLNQLAHPELKRRFRTFRLLAFRREQNPKLDLDSPSDEKVVELFCEAHKEMAPRDNRVEYFDDYVSSEVRGNYAIVVFDSGWRSKVSSQSHRSRNEIILKKSDDRWLFLWSGAVSVHVDLDWDPHRDIPN